MIKPIRLGYSVDAEKNNRDVEYVSQNARFVLYVDTSGDVCHITDNKYGVLSVIAVIGRAHIGNNITADTILLEIGLWRTRPYRKTEAPNRKTKNRERIRITGRRKFADLNNDQFMRTWPYLEELLFQHARTKIAQWKPESLRWSIAVQTEYPRLGTKYALVSHSTRTIHFHRGVRCTISTDDSLMVNTILASNAHSQIWWLNQRIKFARLCLNNYMHGPASVDLLRSNIHNGEKKLCALATYLQLPPHFYALMLEREVGRHRELLSQFIEAANLANIQEVHQLMPIVNGHSRFRDSVRIQIIRQIRSASILVFQVSPSCEEIIWEKSPDECGTHELPLFDDDIPF